MTQSIIKALGQSAGLLFDSATEEDLPEILEIYNHAILNTTSQWDYRPHTLERRTEWFRAAQRDGYPIIVVREASDPSRRILGWGSLGTFHAKEGYRFTVEDSIYVGDGCQGRVLGRHY